LPNKAGDGKDFSDGDGVNPDGAGLWGAGGLYASRDKSHALSKSAAILTVAQGLIEPVGEAQQHRQAERKAIEEVEQAMPF
jgi:hypothetical protein